MKIKLIIESKELTKEELQCLIQSIHDCKGKSFPDKGIFLYIEVPELTEAETIEILTSTTLPVVAWRG